MPTSPPRANAGCITAAILLSALTLSPAEVPAAAHGAPARARAAATVPNILGLSKAAATQALQAAGLTLGTVTHAATSAAIPVASVFRQAPGAGAVATAGTAVAITITTGSGSGP
jgi:serine/threonine-protein kinase